MKRLPIYIGVMVVAFIAASFLSAKLNKEQLKFAPEKANLSGTPIAGFHKFASDVQWMRLVNYLGSLQTVDESNVKDVSARLQELIGLDPNLEKIYKDGALLISIADPQKTVEFLDTACKNEYLKNNWQIPFYAGYVMMHNAKPANYDEAVRFFDMAMKRAGSDSGASYVVSSYFRAKAKSLAQKNPAFKGDERVALLQVLFDEWETNQKSGIEGSYGRESSYAQNLNDRIIKALKDVKVASDDYTPTEAGKKLADKVINRIFDKAHICSNCTSTYDAGDKHCATCGNKVPVWGLCKVDTCKAKLKGGNAPYCTVCGAKQK